MDARYVLLIDILNVHFQNNFPAISQIILANRGFDIQYSDYNSENVDYVNISAKFLFIEDAQRAFNQLQAVRTIVQIRFDDIEGEDYIDEFTRYIVLPRERPEERDEKESEDVMRIHENNLRMLGERENMFIISFPEEYSDDIPAEILENDQLVRRVINRNKIILFYREYQHARDVYTYLIIETNIPNIVLSHRGIIILSSEYDMIDNTHLFQFSKDTTCNIL